MSDQQTEIKGQPNQAIINAQKLQGKIHGQSYQQKNINDSKGKLRLNDPDHLTGKVKTLDNIPDDYDQVPKQLVFPSNVPIRKTVKVRDSPGSQALNSETQIVNS